MNSTNHGAAAGEHRAISALIPWYVNGSIGEQERQRVDAHLLGCAQCRDELALERRVYQGMNAETTVEYMPAASLKRLQARLDGIESAAPAAAAAPGSGKPGRRSLQWQGLMAASVAVMAVALSVLAADRWMHFHGAGSAQPEYHTVTNAAARAPDEVIRAVFSPAVTLVELQAILDEAGLRIISGPTEAGVYSLAATSRRPVNASLALLRANARVRFAESTQPGMRPGDSP
ncbi:MAG TPA: zf-HC2 domain-containing protein [Steroidobacteraceae bacterium]|nr:zf-HC2 domain-containing protein [Steroidobacteraceae bacterium]